MILTSHDLSLMRNNPGASFEQRNQDCDIKAVVRDYQSGLTLNEAARKYNLGFAAVRRKLIESGVRIRSKKEAAELARKLNISGEIK